MKMSDLPAGAKLNIVVKSGDKSGTFHAMVIKPTKNGVMTLFTDFPSDKKITFNREVVEVYYYRTSKSPLTWRGVGIGYEAGYYHISSKTDAANYNRRTAHRIAVKVNGSTMLNGQSIPGFIKDISISGFALIDREKRYNLAKGDTVGFVFSDLGYNFSLRGKVRRIKEENGTLYGCQLTNQNNDLRDYLIKRERVNRSNK